MPIERSPQTEDKYIVRFPEGMRDQLKAEAKRNNRTLNSEILARLEASLRETLKSDHDPELNSAINHHLEQFSSKMEVLALEKEIAFLQLQLRGLRAQIDASHNNLRRQQAFVDTLLIKRDSAESTGNIAAWRKLESEFLAEDAYANELKADLESFKKTTKEIQEQMHQLRRRKEELLRLTDH